MFIGVEYFVDEKAVRVSVDRRDQQVPVLLRRGGYTLVPLGEGEKVEGRSPGNFHSWPENCVVTLPMLKAPQGLWRRWRSAVRPVKVPVARFYDTDTLGYPRAHDLQPGQYLQGALVLKSRTNYRVYFVIVLEPNTTVQEGRWSPRVVGVP